jgi:hypothetical protein
LTQTIFEHNTDHLGKKARASRCCAAFAASENFFHAFEEVAATVFPKNYLSGNGLHSH